MNLLYLEVIFSSVFSMKWKSETRFKKFIQILKKKKLPLFTLNNIQKKSNILQIRLRDWLNFQNWIIVLDQGLTFLSQEILFWIVKKKKKIYGNSLSILEKIKINTQSVIFTHKKMLIVYLLNVKYLRHLHPIQLMNLCPF